MSISNYSHNFEKLLFTPGPLTTSESIKEASLADLGSRDSVFIDLVAEIRQKLLKLAHVQSPEYEAVIIQGSGTFGVESVISSAIPGSGKLLNIINGAYGRRISQMARIHNIHLIEAEYSENQLPDLNEIESLLTEHPEISHISIVHGETTTGLLNPLNAIADLASRFNKVLIVDAMSTFGAYEIYQKSLNISFLIASSNKCIESIPGFSFILAARPELEKCKQNARTLALDIYDQWEGLNNTGQFRFTPPVQSLLAFHEALHELDREGGIMARGQRYEENNHILVKGMRKLGFRLYLNDDIRSYIITSFHYPEDIGFSFDSFYSKLNEKGFVIYPGKLSKVDCFRIGNIGNLFPSDMHNLIRAIGEVTEEMNIKRF